MSFIVRQKVKGRTYAYEVESYWDREKKQPRQRRRYLGVVDEETGEIVAKRFQRDVRVAKDYGPVYLLDKIAEEIDLRRKLAGSFGGDGDALLALAMARVMEPGSLRLLHHVLERSFLPELFSMREECTSQRLSRFLERIGGKEREMNAFYASLIDNKEALVYDITSLSSYSGQLEWLEYGYNRDGDGLPQINLGLVVSLTSRMPILLKIFPGSVTDVVTLRNFVEEMRSFGVSNCLFILDRGFYSEGNIELLSRAKIDFILPLPFGRKVGKETISETNRSIGNPENARMFRDEVCQVIESELEVAGVRLNSYLLLSREREAEENQAFYRRLMDIENALEGKEARYSDPYRHFEEVAGRFSRYLECVVRDRVIHLRRRQKAIAQEENRFGKTILLSSKRMPWEEVLALYRERDEAERQFHQLKNELRLLPMRVRRMETLRGLLLVFFIALLLRSRLLRKAGEAGLLTRHSIEDILLEMSKIRAVECGERWLLTEVPRKARTILEKLKIGVPVGVST